MKHEEPKIQGIAESVKNLMEEVKMASLSGSEAIQLLQVTETSAGLEAAELTAQLRKEHGPELFEVLIEVMSWYRNRTTREMPLGLQDRALDVLWRAQGKPSSGNILEP